MLGNLIIVPSRWGLDTSDRSVGFASLRNKSKGQVFFERANRDVPEVTTEGDVCECDMGLADVACVGQLEDPTSSGVSRIDLLIGISPLHQGLPKRDFRAEAAMVEVLEGDHNGERRVPISQVGRHGDMDGHGGTLLGGESDDGSRS